MNHVAGSRTISLSSPDSFTSITGAQGEPALLCEKYTARLLDLPILVFWSRCQSSCTVLGSENDAYCKMWATKATFMKSVPDSLDRWGSFCREEQVLVSLMGLGPSTASLINCQSSETFSGQPAQL